MLWLGKEPKPVSCINERIVKLGYNKLGYKEPTVITNKFLVKVRLSKVRFG